MNKLILGTTIILGLGFSSVKAQNKPFSKQNKLKKMENKMEVIGNKFKADFGEYVFELNFQSEKQLTFRSLGSDNLGASETVNITKVEIRPNVYMVYWKEKSGTTVTHVEDFEKGIVYTNITSPDHNFINLKGTLTF